MTDIKPRWGDGVPWCDAGCPNAQLFEHGPEGVDWETGAWCEFVAPAKWTCIDGTELCPHAVRRMAVELEAWRSERLHRYANSYITKQVVYDTIDAAVDALIAEGVE